MSRRSRRSHVDIFLALALCVVALGAHRVNLALDERVEELRADGDVGPLPDGKVLRVLSLGFERLVADLFWLRTVYYVGSDSSAKVRYPAAERLANLVTDIDPSFRTVYVVMSNALDGLRGDPDAGIRLLQKGIKHVDYWKLHFMLGFSYFMEKLDYVSAGEQMRLAAEKGGPPYLPLLSARLYAQGGEPETALAFIQARLEATELPEARRALEKRYWDLWISRDLKAIDTAIAAYRRDREEDPRELSALVDAGFLPRAPLDPRGGAYRIRAGRASTDLVFQELKLHGAPRLRPKDYEEQYEALDREQPGGKR